MSKKKKSGKERAGTTREQYYEQIDSMDAAEDREGFYIGFYGRAVSENNGALQDIIVSDAAFRWSMFQDETRDFLNRRINQPAA